MQLLLLTGRKKLCITIKQKTEKHRTDTRTVDSVGCHELSGERSRVL